MTERGRDNEIQSSFDHERIGDGNSGSDVDERATRGGAWAFEIYFGENDFDSRR
jgi:hypothetical protein